MLTTCTVNCICSYVAMQYPLVYVVACIWVSQAANKPTGSTPLQCTDMWPMKVMQGITKLTFASSACSDESLILLRMASLIRPCIYSYSYRCAITTCSPCMQSCITSHFKQLIYTFSSLFRFDLFLYTYIGISSYVFQHNQYYRIWY